MTVALIDFIILLFTGLPLYVNLGIVSFLYMFMTHQPMMAVVQRTTQAAHLRPSSRRIAATAATQGV